MITPTIRSWGNTLDVVVPVDIAAEIHVGLVDDFTPSVDTFQGVIFGPDTAHLMGLPPMTDLYVRLRSMDGAVVSDTTSPQQVTA